MIFNMLWTRLGDNLLYNRWMNVSSLAIRIEYTFVVNRKRIAFVHLNGVFIMDLLKLFAFAWRIKEICSKSIKITDNGKCTFYAFQMAAFIYEMKMIYVKNRSCSTRWHSCSYYFQVHLIIWFGNWFDLLIACVSIFYSDKKHMHIFQTYQKLDEKSISFCSTKYLLRYWHCYWNENWLLYGPIKLFTLN